MRGAVTQLSHLVMKTEDEGIRAELSDLEQTLQPSKQSDKGHHLEAGELLPVQQVKSLFLCLN